MASDTLLYLCRLGEPPQNLNWNIIMEHEFDCIDPYLNDEDVIPAWGRHWPSDFI